VERCFFGEISEMYRGGVGYIPPGIYPIYPHPYRVEVYPPCVWEGMLVVQGDIPVAGRIYYGL
jgi:hypothetical protein